VETLGLETRLFFELVKIPRYLIQRGDHKHNPKRLVQMSVVETLCHYKFKNYRGLSRESTGIDSLPGSKSTLTILSDTERKM
jgi:hypothetical protein